MYEEINPYMVTPAAMVPRITEQKSKDEWTHNPTYGEVLPMDLMNQELEQEQEQEDGWTSNPTYSPTDTWAATMQSNPTTPTDTTPTTTSPVSHQESLADGHTPPNHPTPRQPAISTYPNYYKQSL